MRFLAILTLLFLCGRSFASHNVGGSISYEYISGTTYEITITTNTKFQGPAADADRCILSLGILRAGVIDTVEASRVNGSNGMCPSPSTDGLTFLLGGVVYKVNVYKVQYTFLQTGSYTLFVDDPNREGGINNIPNSEQVVMHIETTLEINAFINCPVNSVVCDYGSIAGASVGSAFSYNPFAISPDGDSLWFELIVPQGYGGNSVQGFSFPAGMTINGYTGLVSWPNPNFQGDWVIAIKISQYRNGYFLGYVLKEVMIKCVSQGSFTGNFQNGPGGWALNAQGDYEVHTTAGAPIDAFINYNCPGIITNNMTAIYGGLPSGAVISTITNGDTLSCNIDWTPFVADIKPEPYIFNFSVRNATPSFFFDIAYSVLVYVDGAFSPLCATLGMEEKETKETLKVYPSPAKDFVSCDYANIDCNKITLIDILGNEIYSEKLIEQEKIVTLDLRSIAAGAYYIVLKKDQTTVNSQLIIIEP